MEVKLLEGAVILPLLLSEWPPRFRELFEERAALMAEDGELNLFAAERLAEFDIRKIAKEETP